MVNYPRGERHSNSKLTYAKAEDIREAGARGVSSGELGKKYGVDPSQIRKVLRGEAWTLPKEDR